MVNGLTVIEAARERKHRRIHSFSERSSPVVTCALVYSTPGGSAILRRRSKRQDSAPLVELCSKFIVKWRPHGMVHNLVWGFTL